MKLTWVIKFIIKSIVKHLSGKKVIEKNSNLNNTFSSDIQPDNTTYTVKLKPGVNLVGLARSVIGLGEGIRASAKALLYGDVQFCVYNLMLGGHVENDDQLDRFMSRANPYSVNLIHINPNEIPETRERLKDEFFENRYNIGFWAWEIDEFPDVWVSALDYVDEVWAFSFFNQSSIAIKSKKPVLRMPVIVNDLIEGYQSYSREYFNLSNSAFIFLTCFDFASTMARKNPAATIRAFKSAFPKQNQVILVVKSINGSMFPNCIDELRNVIGDDPRIICIDKEMSPAESHALKRHCDCYISLHRSEGFGYNIAESMAIGKPVIATYYSGNTDYMRSDNSCPVNFSLIKIQEGEYLYSSGQQWADPDIEHAIWYMRKVYEDAEFAGKIIANAKRYMAEFHSPQYASKYYIKRLKFLGLI